MYRGMKVAVVVPAYNEARHIQDVVSSVPRFVDWVVVVDDASTDGTAEAARRSGRSGLRIVRHAHNRGVGQAIVTGYRRAQALGADVAAVMAGDGQMAPEDLPGLLDALAEGADYAKGNRFRHPRVFWTMPLDRLVGNVALSLATRYASGYRHIFDSQCGYTAIRLEVLGRLEQPHLFWGGYGYCNDLLCRLHRVGASVVDVPVRPVYNGAKSGIWLGTVAFPIGLVLATGWLARVLDERAGALGRRAASALEAWKRSEPVVWREWADAEGRQVEPDQAVTAAEKAAGTDSNTLSAFWPSIFRTTRSGTPARSRASVSLGR